MVHQQRQKDGAKEYDRQRGSSHQRGYDARWRKARLMFLRENPLCVECQRQGKLTAATVVDHIVAHKGNKELFWDRSNWQSLCLSCNSVKAAREEGGFGNKLGLYNSNT